MYYLGILQRYTYFTDKKGYSITLLRFTLDLRKVKTIQKEDLQRQDILDTKL